MSDHRPSENLASVRALFQEVSLSLVSLYGLEVYAEQCKFYAPIPSLWLCCLHCMCQVVCCSLSAFVCV